MASSRIISGRRPWASWPGSRLASAGRPGLRCRQSARDADPASFRAYQARPFKDNTSSPNRIGHPGGAGSRQGSLPSGSGLSFALETGATTMARKHKLVTVQILELQRERLEAYAGSYGIAGGADGLTRMVMAAFIEMLQDGENHEIRLPLMLTQVD